MRIINHLFLLSLIPGLYASTFTLGSDPNQLFGSKNVGPYSGTLTGATAIGFFCLDETLSATFGASYSGTTKVPTTPQEEEAAFLATYALYLGSPSSNQSKVNTVEGPISFAIWQIMGTLGNTPPDPAAQHFIQIAQDAYSHNLIPQAYLNTVLIFSPSNTNVQRFITAVSNNAEVLSASSAISSVPEPGTACLVLVGLALCEVSFVLARRRRRLLNQGGLLKTS